jgi:hypothetical protein
MTVTRSSHVIVCDYTKFCAYRNAIRASAKQKRIQLLHATDSGLGNNSVVHSASHNVER